MSMVAIATFAAAVLFAGFHVPFPQRRDGGRVVAPFSGRPARLLGIAYHLLLLPAIVTLPAPSWAVAAGLAWMIVDVVLNGAEFAGATVDAGPYRNAVHVLSALWLIVAGWSNGIVLGVAGTALAIVFVYRFLLAGTTRSAPRTLLHVNAALNVLWMILLGIHLI